MEENTKKYRFNIIDLLVIVAILAVIGFCGYKIYTYYTSTIASYDDAELSSDTYVCVVEVKRVPIEAKDNFKVGDVVYNSTSTKLGKITAVVSSPATEVFTSTEETLTESSISYGTPLVLSDGGQTKTILVPDHVDLQITMELQTKPEFIYVGKDLTFKTEYATANGFILSRESK